jgi:hypothetical protein
MIPELNSMVVITSSLDGATQARSYKEPIFALLRTQIIPMLASDISAQTTGATTGK